MHRSQEMERQIGQSPDLVALRSLRDNVHGAFDTALEQSAETVEIVNDLHDAFIRRTLAIAEERVRTSHRDVPPVSSFTFLLFGSGGRREQTLWSDQDNGMIYVVRDGASPECAELYIRELAEAFRSALEKVGYPPCEGNVLVTNPQWRKTAAAWNDTFEAWLNEPAFETVRHMLIAVDARPIYGDERLASLLQTQLLAGITSRRGTILPRMLQNTLRYKMLIGVLGNLLTEPYGEDTGGIDIKYGAYLPMVNAIRLLAVSRQVTVTSTLARIEALKACEGIRQETAADWEEAFRTVLKLRAMTPYQVKDGKFSARGVVPARMLTKEVKRELKRALRIGTDLQRKLKRTFGTEGHL